MMPSGGHSGGICAMSLLQIRTTTSSVNRRQTTQRQRIQGWPVGRPVRPARHCVLGHVQENDRMAIKVIVELRARPGRRDQLQSLLENMIATQGSNQHGFLGSTRYEVLDDADLLVEIADWESAEARMAHMQEAVATGAYKPLLELLAAPFRVTAIRRLP
jgi:quinol monooxygenase YgiN